MSFSPMGSKPSTRPSGRPCRRRWGRINFLTGGLLLVPLISVCIYLWMMAGPTGTGKSYLQTVVDAKKSAKEQVDEVELGGLYSEMQMFLITHDVFPTKAQLEGDIGSAIAEKYLNPHAGKDAICLYIEGQSPRNPPTNVLVYQADIPKGEDGAALLCNGRVVLYSAEDMARAVERTKANLTGH
jgi:hypothetical protein